MNGQQRTTVEVTVYDATNRLLPNARVTIEPQGQASCEAISLEFNEQLGVYRATGISPGLYSLQAEAEGFECDRREVQVDSSGLKDLFILGREGMLFFYRGKVRVPFEPPRDLLAVSLASGMDEDREADLLALANRLELQLEQVSAAIAAENVRIFRLSSTDDRDRQEIQQRLAEHPSVQLTGPIVRLDSESVSFLTNELVVKFKAHITEADIPAIARRYNLETIRSIPYAGNAFLFRTNTPASYALLQICAALVQSGAVEYAEPNMVSTAVEDAVNPTDFLYSDQWHLPLIQAPDAWQVLGDINPDLTFGSPNIIIAVMDSGVDSTHPDFTGNVSDGSAKIYQLYDFVNMVANNNSLAGDHGTACAGVSTALANNSSVVAGENEGSVGIAGNCRLMGLRRSGPETRYADAYIWAAGFDPQSTTPGFPVAISPGADIITNSFGYSVGMPISGLMKDCFDYLTTYGRAGKGVILFFSAGNNNTTFNLQRPWAAYEKTITVAASTNANVRAGYSNYGIGIDVCAPSGTTLGASGPDGITTCTIVGTGTLAGHTGGSLDYQDNFGGTSSATPLTAGLAALMLSLKPSLTWVEVRQILWDTAIKIDPGNTDPTGRWRDISGLISSDPGYAGPDYSQWYGYGRIDALAAVTGARDYASNRDIVLRDNLSDVGAVPVVGAFWDSPDLWVRNLDPAVDGAAALPATYDSAPPHENPIAGQNNWVYVRMKNIGTAPSFNFYIRVYLAHFPGFEFVYPNNFIPTNKPGQPVPTPMQPGTYLIGEYRYSSLAAGASDIINVVWPAALIPPKTVTVAGVTVNWHPCLLVEISPQDGPAPTGVHTWDNNNLAQKNIAIVYPDDNNAFAAAVVLGNQSNRFSSLDLLVDRTQLPSTVRLYVDLTNPKAKARLREFVRQRSNPVLGCLLAILLPFAFFLPAQLKQKLLELGKRPVGDRYNFTLGNYQGREVAWLAPQEKTFVPVFAEADELIPAIVGGVVEQGVPPGSYDINLIQLDPNGKVSGGFGVQLRIGG
jgi:subtilisin family serine protease